jgi:hypothetical protein
MCPSNIQYSFQKPEAVTGHIFVGNGYNFLMRKLNLITTTVVVYDVQADREETLNDWPND